MDEDPGQIRIQPRLPTSPCKKGFRHVANSVKNVLLFLDCEGSISISCEWLIHKMLIPPCLVSPHQPSVCLSVLLLPTFPYSLSVSSDCPSSPPLGPVNSLMLSLPIYVQREQSEMWRDLCCQSHVTHGCSNAGHSQLLHSGGFNPSNNPVRTCTFKHVYSSPV